MMRSISKGALTGAPETFRKLMENLERWIDRRLGYTGEERFVFFYFEPMTGQVIWNDGHSYGPGVGAWGVFMERIVPLGKRYGVNLGKNGLAKTHVLLIDRMEPSAYFVEEWEAENFLTSLGRNEAA